MCLENFGAYCNYMDNHISMWNPEIGHLPDEDGKYCP